MKILSILILVFIAGCTGSPLSSMPKEELRKIPDGQLCAAYAYSKSKKLKAELMNRNLFNVREWRAIEDSNVFVGMSKNAMLAARPNLYLIGVSKIGDYGMVEIYNMISQPVGEMATIVDAYIYVQNDKVAGYQMW